MCIKFWTQKRMLIERTFFIIVLVKKIPNSKLGYLFILSTICKSHAIFLLVAKGIIFYTHCIYHQFIFYVFILVIQKSKF